jgi:ParB-like nuclease domain
MTSRRMKDRLWPATLDPGLKSEIKARNRDRRESLRRLSAAESATGARRNDLLPPLELATIRLDELRISPRRLRKPDPAHVREIANSIETLGFCPPILIGMDNDVIDGVSRIGAARLVNLDSAPCIRVGHLSDDEQRILRLAVNRLAEKGKIEFTELILKDAPIEISGFTPDEIDQIVVLDPSDGVECGPLAPEADAVPVARLGDMFRLGPGRIDFWSLENPISARGRRYHRVVIDEAAFAKDGDNREARLGLPEQPRSYLHERAGHQPQPANLTSRSAALTSRCSRGRRSACIIRLWIVGRVLRSDIGARRNDPVDPRSGPGLRYQERPRSLRANRRGAPSYADQ